jgi:hypothetical protein
MSQAGVINTSSGPVPPSVPTSFVTQNGTAVPALNILLVNGATSTENNTNGIISKGGVIGTGTSNEMDLVLTNRVTGSVTTTDATLTTLISFTLPAAGVYAFDVNIAALNTTDSLGASYALFVGVRGTGAAAVKLNLEDKIVNEEAGNTLCNSSVSVSGNNVLFQVTGIAGKTFKWSGVGTYVFVSP